MPGQSSPPLYGAVALHRSLPPRLRHAHGRVHLPGSFARLPRAYRDLPAGLLHPIQTAGELFVAAPLLLLLVVQSRPYLKPRRPPTEN